MYPFLQRIRACLLIIAAAHACGTAQARPAVIITVDVESIEPLPLPAQRDILCEQQAPCGLNYMTAMLEQRGMAGTFFLNVYEQKAWGATVLRDIAQRLQTAGHDVALHTHPQWAYDPQRPYMYSYSLEDQSRIIADGVRALQEWTGLPVVAHRAGAYSANKDTITALERSGIVLDSSLFLHHPHSLLNGLGLPANTPAMIGKVVEMPVTVYERHERPAGWGQHLPQYIALGKVDVDAIANEREAAAAVAAVVAADLPYLVVFLHSFSFIAAPPAADLPARADSASMKVFASLLDAIVAQRLQVVTTRQLVARQDAIDFGERDVVPAVNNAIPAHKYVVRMLRSLSTGGKAAVGLIALAGLTLAIYLPIALRRRGTRATAVKTVS